MGNLLKGDVELHVRRPLTRQLNRKVEKLIELAKDDLAELAADIRTLADTEGLTAHRRSVEARLPPAANAWG